MITYFTEQDLVSFGNYMVSDTRKTIYLEQKAPEAELPKILAQVNNADLTNWFTLVVRQRQEEEKVTAELSDESPQMDAQKEIIVE